MWAIVNNTPYGVDRIWGRDKEGVHEWIVAVKATYDIKANGALTLAEEQSKPLLIPEYNGEDGASSLKYDAELVSPKPTTDVLLNGVAHAPKGKPVAEFLVSLRVGDIRKTIKVVGNRIWKQGALGLAASGTEPISQVPIVYERAFGGWDRAEPDPKKQRFDAPTPLAVD